MMDFSYFTAGPQPYHFFGLPHSQENGHSNIDEFNTNNASDQYDAAFAAFQQSFHYDPSTYVAQPHGLPPQSESQSPEKSTPVGHDSTLSIPEIDPNNIQIAPNDISPDENANGATNRSSSEEKDSLTPQQSRRKAQNRAAQRAFRERKEKHVKDLEMKLNSLQHQSATLNGENERLRREIAKIATENEILRATSGSSSNGPTPFLTEPDELVGPLGYVPTDNPSIKKIAGEELSSKYAHFGTLKMLTLDDETGEPLLGAGATWDYIQAHELFQKGLVDVGDVCERLKKMARCDGKGPVFQESDVRQAIRDSAVAGGRDELI